MRLDGPQGGDWRRPQPSARRDAGVLERTIRRAARRLCRSEVGLVCMPRFRGCMRGGADCARARISPDGVRIRQAIACRLFAARTRAALSDGWHRPARAGPCVNDPGTPEPRRSNAMPSPHPQGGPPQARFHPHPDCRPALAGTRGEDFSGGWLGRSARQDVPRGPPVQADPAASGTRRCTASSIVPPHVTADTRRPSSRLDRHVDDPSGDGSADNDGIGFGQCGQDGVDFRAMARRAPSPPRWGRMRISAP
jgi:hypothetical protein